MAKPGITHGTNSFLRLYGHPAREDNAAALLGNDITKESLPGVFEASAFSAQERSLN